MMNPCKPAFVAVVVCALGAASSGCTSTALNRDLQSGANTTPLPVPNSQQPSTYYRAPIQPAQVPATLQDQASLGPRATVAQVGYTQGVAPGTMVPGMTQAMPAGFLRRNCLNKNQSAGDCNCCPSSPQEGCGFIETTPMGWNAYGVDPQEFICDGGDHDPRARLLRNNTLDGLQGEDTVVHYTTEGGDIKVQPSNRVCVYSPRFASTRRISQAVEGDRTISLANVEQPLGSLGLDRKQGGITMAHLDGPRNAEVTKRIDAIRDRERGIPIENVLQADTQGRVMAALATLQLAELNVLQRDQMALIREAANSAIVWTVDNGVEVAVDNLKPPTLDRYQKLDGFTVYDFPDEGRLRILKMADRDQAQPGELVTFSIRVDNVGDSPVTDVVLTDNLTTRLEYVEGTQESTQDTEFTTKINAERSLMLQWKLTKPLEVGESATVTFQCRLR